MTVYKRRDVRIIHSLAMQNWKKNPEKKPAMMETHKLLQDK